MKAKEFKIRFKDKIKNIDKNGHLGVVRATTRSIEKHILQSETKLESQIADNPVRNSMFSNLT
jgi:hypothetical protein